MVVAEGDNLNDVVAVLLAVGSTDSITNLRTVQTLTMQKANAARFAYRTPGPRD